MKTLLIFLGLFLTLNLSGQISAVVASQSGAVTPGFDSGILRDGAFVSGTTYWGVTGGVTIGSGSVTFDDATGGTLLQHRLDMITPQVINTSYTLTFTLTGASGGGIYFNITTVDDGDYYELLVTSTEYTNGDKTVVFTTPANLRDGGIALNFLTAGDSGGTITNLKLVVTP